MFIFFRVDKPASFVLRKVFEITVQQIQQTTCTCTVYRTYFALYIYTILHGTT